MALSRCSVFVAANFKGVSKQYMSSGTSYEANPIGIQAIISTQRK
jgi:hypothetical protein